MIKILAFDPGLNLGYALMNDDEYVLSDFVRNDNKQPMTARMLLLTSKIAKLLAEWQPDFVVVEAINRVGGGAVNNKKNESSWALYWVYGEIIRLAALHGKEVSPINPTTMKACIVPKETRSDEQRAKSRSASKDEVATAVRALTGQALKTRSDETDAVGLAITFYRIYTGAYVVGAAKKSKKRKKVI